MIAATVLIALATPAATPSPPAATPAPMSAPTATASLAEAGRAIAAGRLDQARAMLSAAIAAGASGPALDRLLADLALARGDNAQALAAYRAVLAAYPDETLLLERAGRAALRLGRVDEATALLDRATARADASWRAWDLGGIAADRRGDWAAANAAYARAAALAPSEAEVANNHGWSLMLQGRWDEAARQLDRAVTLDPHLGRAVRNRDLARAALAADLPQRQPGEGADDYAARLNDAGVAARARGETGRAIAAFAQAIELSGRYYRRAAANLAAVQGAAQ